MPGFVKVGAIIFAAIFVIVATLVIFAICRSLFKTSKTTSFLTGLSISFCIAFWLMWSAFGEHHTDIGVSSFDSSFPELVQHGAKGIRGHEWIDDLSDGEYYMFSIESENFDSFVSKYSLTSGADPHGYNNYLTVAGGVTPDWMPDQDCEDGKAYHSVDLSSGYFTRFNFYYCPIQKIGYMAYVRI